MVPYLWEKTLFPPLLAKGEPGAALALLAHPNPNCDLKFKVGRFLSKAFWDGKITAEWTLKTLLLKFIVKWNFQI